jgi:hypothetical protein
MRLIVEALKQKGSIDDLGTCISEVILEVGAWM